MSSSRQRRWEASAVERTRTLHHVPPSEENEDEAVGEWMQGQVQRSGQPHDSRDMARAVRVLARMENAWEATARERARFIRRRLLNAEELEPGEADFYGRYFLGRTWTPEQVPAVVKRNQHAWPHVEVAGGWSDFHLPPTYYEWEMDFGEHVPHPVDPQGGIVGLLAVRESMIADGKLHLPGMRRKRGKPVSGDYTASLYLGRRTYVPLEPCEVHPWAEHSTRHRRCTECNRERKQEHKERAEMRKPEHAAAARRFDEASAAARQYMALLERKAEEMPSATTTKQRWRAVGMYGMGERGILALAEEAAVKAPIIQRQLDRRRKRTRG
jgi:hypothetical protein